MGGTQSLNRATYSKILPDTDDPASYFSFYEVLEKGVLIIGMFGWGYIEGLTGSMHNSVLAMTYSIYSCLHSNDASTLDPQVKVHYAVK